MCGAQVEEFAGHFFFYLLLSAQLLRYRRWTFVACQRFPSDKVQRFRDCYVILHYTCTLWDRLTETSHRCLLRANRAQFLPWWRLNFDRFEHLTERHNGVAITFQLAIKLPLYSLLWKNAVCELLNYLNDIEQHPFWYQITFQSKNCYQIRTFLNSGQTFHGVASAASAVQNAKLAHVGPKITTLWLQLTAFLSKQNQENRWSFTARAFGADTRIGQFATIRPVPRLCRTKKKLRPCVRSDVFSQPLICEFSWNYHFKTRLCDFRTFFIVIFLKITFISLKNNSNAD